MLFQLIENVADIKSLPGYFSEIVRKQGQDGRIEDIEYRSLRQNVYLTRFEEGPVSDHLDPKATKSESIMI